jgi:hypothetical protein
MKRLLIVGSEDEILNGERWTRMNPKSVLSSLWSWEAKFDPTPQSAARLVERWIYWHSRMIVQDANNLLRELKTSEVEER